MEWISIDRNSNKVEFYILNNSDLTVFFQSMKSKSSLSKKACFIFLLLKILSLLLKF